MSGFYDPHFYDSGFPFYDMQHQQMLLSFVFNARTSPAVPQNSQQPEGANAQPSVPSIGAPRPEISSSSYMEEDNGEKRKPKAL